MPKIIYIYEAIRMRPKTYFYKLDEFDSASAVALIVSGLFSDRSDIHLPKKIILNSRGTAHSIIIENIIIPVESKIDGEIPVHLGYSKYSISENNIFSWMRNKKLFGFGRDISQGHIRGISDLEILALSSKSCELTFFTEKKLIKQYFSEGQHEELSIQELEEKVSPHIKIDFVISNQIFKNTTIDVNLLTSVLDDYPLDQDVLLKDRMSYEIKKLSSTNFDLICYRK